MKDIAVKNVSCGNQSIMANFLGLNESVSIDFIAPPPDALVEAIPRQSSSVIQSAGRPT
jgi:hypothetical protein